METRYHAPHPQALQRIVGWNSQNRVGLYPTASMAPQGSPTLHLGLFRAKHIQTAGVAFGPDHMRHYLVNPSYRDPRHVPAAPLGSRSLKVNSLLYLQTRPDQETFSALFGKEPPDIINFAPARATGPFALCVPDWREIQSEMGRRGLTAQLGERTRMRSLRA